MISNNAPFLRTAPVWLWSPYVWITSGFSETFAYRNKHQLPVMFFPNGA